MTTAFRQRMLQVLQLAGLSRRTQEAYLRSVRQLADHFHTPPDRLNEHQVRDDFLHLMNDRKFASASLVIASSAGLLIEVDVIPRIKRNRSPPRLDGVELGRLEPTAPPPG